MLVIITGSLVHRVGTSSFVLISIRHSQLLNHVLRDIRKQSQAGSPNPIGRSANSVIPCCAEGACCCWPVRVGRGCYCGIYHNYGPLRTFTRWLWHVRGYGRHGR